jgi:hypothetical protein
VAIPEALGDCFAPLAMTIFGRAEGLDAATDLVCKPGKWYMNWSIIRILKQELPGATRLQK